jgi:hypothetical protein
LGVSFQTKREKEKMAMDLFSLKYQSVCDFKVNIRKKQLNESIKL